MEVKSAGDHLSVGQQAWLDVLRNAGVASSVCRVMPQARRRSDEGT